MTSREHGGGIGAAIARWGGKAEDWIDLSTGINPVPYPLGKLPARAWTALPDRGAFTALEDAARTFWQVPDHAAILAAPGASALIARIPAVMGAPGKVAIPGPTYNEHAAAFAAAGWQAGEGPAPVQVVVHPNNPDGRLWQASDLPARCVIDESFCDIALGQSLLPTLGPSQLVLKSFGKFWGLAGLRLGFAIGDSDLIAALSDMLGPWQVSGPALAIGTAALRDPAWATATRARLASDAARLDTLLTSAGGEIIGGTPLFRLIRQRDASGLHDRLGQAHILTRPFSYAPDWLRFGLPGPADWPRIEAAL